MEELLIGIDWSQAYYDVAILAINGAVLSQFRINNTTAGLKQWKEKIAKFAVPPESCLVGIETHHNILFDFLLSCQYQVYVIAPHVVNSSRGRFGASGAHTDRTDARLIADLLRTDRQRFAPWRPDSSLLNQIKLQLSHIDNLTKTTIQHSNRLQAILLRVYPQPLQAFSKIAIPIAMHFLMAYPTPAALENLSMHEFTRFCRDHHCHPTRWIRKWYEALQCPTPEANPSLAEAYVGEITFLAGLLLSLIQEKKRATEEAHTLFLQHPDQAIFASLPGAGLLLRPRLLIMFGEDRERYPSPKAIRQLAGTCPVTKQSGKKKQVLFRKACNRDFRDTVQQFAMASVKQADWAAAYYQAAKARGHFKNSAFRCLANRWLGIIWKMWQTDRPYDEAYHLQQIHKHRRPNQ
jgi:transposase